jgi:hypothetical protein
MGDGLDDTNSPFDAEHMKRLSRAYKSELERLPTDARIHSFRVISCVRLTHWMQRMVGDLASSLDAETLRGRSTERSTSGRLLHGFQMEI